MPYKVEIKLEDNKSINKEIQSLYELRSILKKINYQYTELKIIHKGECKNENIEHNSK